MKKYFNFEVGLLIVVAMIFSSYSSDDTTYSQTRLIPKPETHTSQQPRNIERDSCKTLSDKIFGGIFSFVIDGLIVTPVKTLIVGHEHIGDFSSIPFRFGIGGSYTNITFYYNAAFNYALKLDATLLYVPNENFMFRENVGITFPTGNLLLSDFKRDVFVNGSKIGNEVDKGDRYSNFAVPILTEFLYRPEGEYGSMFFSIGAGPCHIIENMVGTRSYSYQSPQDSLSVSSEYWIPFFSIGFGKLLNLSGPYCFFEIKYQVGINPNQKMLSLPGDNSSVLNGFTLLQYEFMF